MASRSIVEAHDAIQQYVRGELRRHTSHEALLALAAVEGVLIEVAASISDGAQGMGEARTVQAMNDAAVVADIGLAIRQVRVEALR